MKKPTKMLVSYRLLTILLLLIVVVFGCEKTNHEITTEASELDVMIGNISGVDQDDLLSFFNVKSSSELIVKKIDPQLKSDNSSDNSIVLIVDSKFDDRIEMADKALYIDLLNENATLHAVLERKESLTENARIEISRGIGEIPRFFIEYDLEKEYTNFAITKWDFEYCFDDCLYDILDGIFNKGSWVRRARFMMNAPVEMMWHIADCTVICAF
jgi:hypothetical protein